MKRKIVSALLVMSMTASLVACGNSGSGSSDPADESVSVSSSASSESDASASASSESEAEAEESEMPEGYDETSTELYNEALGDFNDALATAKEAETVDERYALMAVAEGKLMESAMMYPLTSRGGMYAMYRMAPRTKDYTLWGSDNDRYHQYVVTTDFIKAEDYNEMRAKWDELKGTGTYESWVKEYLAGKGYTLKDSFSMPYASDPVTWDGLATSRAADTDAIINTYDGLMEYDVEGTLQPALAESYEVSDDGLTYTFHLRKDVKWTDSQGREVDTVKADDFVAGMQHMCDAQGGLEYLVQGVIKNVSQYISGEITDFDEVGEWEHPGNAVAKRLTDITPYTDYVEKLTSIFAPDELDNVDTQPEVDYPTYSSTDFLSDVYMSEQNYKTLVNVLKMKKNIILQGAPGVGKTFAAKRLAYSIIGTRNPDRVQMIQFHQSYSYEDFIEGYRPTENGFTIKKGSFYKFCKIAEEDDENDYFFIIDEINRGNLSKIFGELFMLIEKDKRGIELQLLYSDENFSVPSNVYIIGMMNTADRSLAMLDYALRRRFSFFTMKPGFNTMGFQAYQNSLKNDAFDKLISCVKQLNSKIEEDVSLGEGFCIGHSYFCGLTSDTVNVQTLSSIVEYELIPLLKEYWFDEPTKVIDWSERLRSTVI